MLICFDLSVQKALIGIPAVLSPCPRDCLYSDWTNWSTCEPFCLGKQSRSRSVKLEAADGGTACSKEECWCWYVGIEGFSNSCFCCGVTKLFIINHIAWAV